MKSHPSLLGAILVGASLFASPVRGADPAPHETIDKIFVVVQEAGQPLREVGLDKKTVEVANQIKTGLGPLLALSALTDAGLECCPPCGSSPTASGVAVTARKKSRPKAKA